VIQDVESYPAFVDGVHHGNKRTPRTTVMWKAGGVAYVYLVYGMWYQFAAVVNRADVPDVVFIRGVVPVEGIETMTAQWDEPRAAKDLADSPGKLCKSFQITKDLYDIRATDRVGISARHDGHDAPLRYHLARVLTRGHSPNSSGAVPGSPA
jgi:DNA-3-methyladenine glycosylase